MLNPSVNQYENCLRCHGTSTGKTVNPVFGYLPVRTVSAGDPLNMIPQFALTASSSHPVMHDRSSALPQPSLLANMLNLDGVTQGRAMGLRIFCTDCHNSDDNREFGGTGANGPHGSKWTHILERRYEFSQAAVPGQTIGNLFPNPDPSAAGPYALCAKCHSLTHDFVEQQLCGACAPHQRWILLLGVPHGARHGRSSRHDLRRAHGEFRCERGGSEWGCADHLQSRDRKLHVNVSRTVALNCVTFLRAGRSG